MSKPLPRHDWPILITVFLALGGIGMMVIFSFLIGFGFHSPIGKLALYLCFALQLVNVITMAVRRHILRHKYGAPAASKKMRHFALFFALMWGLGALNMIGSLVCAVMGFKFVDPIVVYTCTIGAILSLIGWFGLLAAFHRRREAAILTQVS